MTTPTPPLDLRTHDAAGIAGTLHTPDPAAVERLRAYLAQQPPPRSLRPSAPYATRDRRRYRRMSCARRGGGGGGDSQNNGDA